MRAASLQPVRQSNFTAGELASTLWGRHDLAKYGSGARCLLNFFTAPHGAAMNRPGSAMVGETKGSGAARLEEFPVAGGVFLLEFGAGYIRVWLDDVYTGVEIAAPYAAQDLRRLDLSREADTLTIVHPAYVERELRYDPTQNPAWAIAVVNYAVAAIPQGSFPGEPVLLASSVLPASAERPAKEWQWGVTATFVDELGDVYESQPWIVTQMWTNNARLWDVAVNYHTGDLVVFEALTYVALQGNVGAEPTSEFAPWALAPETELNGRNYAAAPSVVCLYSDRPITLDWSPPPEGSWATPAVEMLGYTVYRRRNGLWGAVGDVGPNELQFKDDGSDPDWSRTPPAGENPFVVKNGDGEIVKTVHPSSVAHYEQRRLFAYGNTIVGSRIGEPNIFDQKKFPAADDAVDFDLASRQHEEIRALVPSRALLVQTSRSEWVVGGDEPLSAVDTPTARPHSQRGSSWLRPLIVGNVALYQQERGPRVRELLFDQGSESYGGADLSLLSTHLLDGHEIVDWAYAESPYGIVWAVREDGVLLSMTYQREQEVISWARHETQGTYESVCTVTKAGVDLVYVIVARTIGGQTKRFIERFLPRKVTDVREAVFLDSSLTYRGPPARHLSGLEHLEGCTVNALADGRVERGLVVVDGAVDLDPERWPDAEDGTPGGASIVHVGLPYVSDLELLDLSPGEGRARVKSVGEVVLEFEGSRGGFVGESFDRKLQEFLQRTRGHGYGAIPLETGVVSIPVNSEWNTGGRAVVRQVDPLPLTILAVTRLVEYGG